MDEQRFAGQRLVQLVGPYPGRQDQTDLVTALEGVWSPECLALLLEDHDPAVVRAAAISLGLIGDERVAPALAQVLSFDDPAVVEAAEDALWSIWFRAKGPLPQRVLTKIAQSIREGETENIATMLTELIRSQPTFAEAYHQRSQAHYLRGAYDEALRDARRAFELNPLHFGALANMANSYAALGRYAEAVKSYRQVLALYPQMAGIRSAIRQIRGRLAVGEPAVDLTLVEAE